MDELAKELDEVLKDRQLADGDGTVDVEVLRLMELRAQLELTEQVETLNKRLADVTNMIRNKF